MKILVVEDKELHRKSAEVTLASHDVTIIDSFDKAMDQMRLVDIKAGVVSQRTFPFEVVLTDMMMPMCQGVLTQNFNPVEQVPYGFVIALKAALCGAKFVAMVTDTNHHQGAMSDALDSLGASYYRDCFKPNFTINGAKVMFVHAPFVGVPDTICPECQGTKEVKHDCYTCYGCGKKETDDPKLFYQRPTEGTVCDACQGSGKKTDRCRACEGDGTDHGGKNWGKVLADLTS